MVPLAFESFFVTSATRQGAPKPPAEKLP